MLALWPTGGRTTRPTQSDLLEGRFSVFCNIENALRLKNRFSGKRASLRRPAAARSFFYAHFSDRGHFFIGSRVASVSGAYIHVRHQRWTMSPRSTKLTGLS